MDEILTPPHNPAEVAFHTDARERPTNLGVSDRRHAELDRLEADAGVAHDAAEAENTRTRAQDAAEQSTPAVEGQALSRNPDSDKR